MHYNFKILEKSSLFLGLFRSKYKFCYLIYDIFKTTWLRELEIKTLKYIFYLNYLPKYSLLWTRTINNNIC